MVYVLYTIIDRAEDRLICFIFLRLHLRVRLHFRRVKEATQTQG